MTQNKYTYQKKVSRRNPVIASRTQFHVERPWGQHPFSIVSLNVNAVVAAFNQEKALVGAFSVIYEPSDGTF